ncbi:MAG: PASTA domain-containing protein [Solobacterium sp.]|nr:PASTA domain-containing protein [Solobacterium sp.]
MADNKDFLSQFSDSGKKPDSFKEEERIPVSKPKKEINPMMIIVPSVVAVIVVVALVYIFVFPHIKVESFVGKSQNDAAAWIKQNEIESAGIVFKEEYSFDVAKGNVVSQTPESGKVKKDAKMTFVISKGADPDELVSLPDIKNMTKSEIESWISENKLSATKINTTYSDTVAKDEVISVDLSVDTDKFTRGTSLKINISKGPAPAGTIKVENFKGQAYSIVENWAKTKKITLKKVEAYDDDMASGLIISQSIAADKEMKEGETLTVTVSKGKGVTVPNFLKMSETEYNTWKDTNTGENAIQVKEKVYYSDSASYVLKQSVTAGTTIAQSEVVIVTINKGDGFYLNEALTALGYDYVEGSTSYDRLDDWSYKAKEIGLNAQVHMYTGNYVASDKPKGTILKIEYAKDEDGNKYSMNEKLPLDVRIFCSVSSGELDKDEYKITADDLSTLGNNNLSYDEVKSWVDNKSAYGFGIEVEYGAPITSESRYTIKGFEYKDSYGNTVLNTNKAEGTVIPYGSVMVISQNGYTPSSGSSGSGSGGTSAAADE